MIAIIDATNIVRLIALVSPWNSEWIHSTREPALHSIAGVRLDEAQSSSSVIPAEQTLDESRPSKRRLASL
jgi:hypothetical protein